jgi:hypothetical protein
MGAAAIGCGAAPEGFAQGDPSNGEEGTASGTGTVKQRICNDPYLLPNGSSACPPEDPDPGPNDPPPPPPGPPDRFRVHVSGIWFANSCESGWEGDAGEFFWGIQGNGANIDSRDEDHYVTLADVEWNGVRLNVTRDFTVAHGAPLTITGSAWEVDDFFEGGNDWLGNFSRTVHFTDVPSTGNIAFFDLGQGGTDTCGFGVDYEISRAP